MLYIAILGTVLWAMLRMALSLENPFGSELQESNKVPVLDLHEKFLEKLVEIYFAPKITDSIPKPYKNAVKKASPKSFRRSDSNIELMKKSRENYSMKRSMSKSRLSFTRRSLTMEAYDWFSFLISSLVLFSNIFFVQEIWGREQKVWH